MESAQQREVAFMELLASVDELAGVKNSLAETFKKGIFNITRARYSMGATQVGFQQYEGRCMNATARVHIGAPLDPACTTEGDDADHISTVAESCPNQSTNKASYGQPFALVTQPTIKHGHSSNKEAEVTSKGLRKRHMQPAMSGTKSLASHPKGTDSVSSTSVPHTESSTADSDSVAEHKGKAPAGLTVESTMEDTTHAPNSSKIPNPITWFNGAGMVPPTLKEAQSDFQKAVQLAVEVANASHRVNVATRTWQEMSAGRATTHEADHAHSGTECGERAAAHDSDHAMSEAGCAGSAMHDTGGCIDSATQYAKKPRNVLTREDKHRREKIRAVKAARGEDVSDDEDDEWD